MSAIEKLPEIVKSIQSSEINKRLDGVTALRKLLSLEQKPPIDEVLQSGVLPILIHFLEYNDIASLQFESLWSISNIASGTSVHTESVVRANAVPIIIKLLNSPSDDVVEQSIWALGNIAGDSAKCRDYVLQMGAMSPLLNVINKQPKIFTLRNAAWTLSNLFRGKPIPDSNLVNVALPTLVQLLNNDDENIVADAAWGLSYYSDGPYIRIQEVIDCGVCKRLATLLTHQNNSIVTPVLRTIGNIATGDDLQTQNIVNDTVLNSLLQLLTNKKASIRKEACWTISNIVAGGNRQQIQSVIDAKIIPEIVSIISNENEDISVIKEAMWVMNNLFASGIKDYINYAIINLECILPIVNLLDNCTDFKLLNVILDALVCLLGLGESFRDDHSINPYIECIECCDGFEKVRLYSNHFNITIVEHVNEILHYKNEMDLDW
ncbi:hypothetical protein ABK040_001584 [Willaertia magna]